MENSTRELLCDFFIHLEKTKEITEPEKFRFLNALRKDSNWSTADEVAAMLKVTKRTVFRLADKGIIKRYKIGKLVRFSKLEILEVMKIRKSKKDNSNES